ncbi:hypothetical protein GCM10022286_09660 [Gryllotalpicola daejeonensis]|uniref:Glutaminase n=1 Tax=Gryllotalpicola daejeonensis TaxID=993087 RepID=A0ABP7ZH75_9MICO
MNEGTDASRDLIAGIRALTLSVATSLTEGGARTEALAELESARRRLGIIRPARMRPLGRVWRLGALLLDERGNLYGTGGLVRAEQPARRSIVALAVAERRELQAAAMRGGYSTGETVNFNAVPVDLGDLPRIGQSGPVVLRQGAAFVRWSPTQPDALIELQPYLADRAELLLHPPEGS